jgi:Tfp pilus assembly protein PilN
MINLLPNKTRDERRYGRLNRKTLAASLWVFAVALVSSSIIAFSWMRIKSEKSKVEKQISENTNQIASLDDARKQIDETAKQLAIIKKLYTGEVQFSKIIPEIGGVIPPGAILTSLSLTGNKDEPLQLSFRTKTQELAPIIRANLVNSSLFQSADIINVSGTSEQGTGGGTPTTGTAFAYPYSISIVVALKGASTAKPTATGAAQ